MVKHFIVRYNPKYPKITNPYNINTYLLHSFLSLYLIFWNNLFQEAVFTKLIPIISRIKNISVAVYATISITLLLLVLIDIFVDIYKTGNIAKRAPISLHTQILKVFIVICSTIIVFSNILDISPATFLTSLGAAAALLTFVFKDTVLGMLASLQLTFQDIIRIGDWITVPQYNIDGDVESVTITVTKIRNFDKTISTVPTAALMSTGIKNWRGMLEAGGRRIKRAIHIDINTIKFCDKKMLNYLKKIPLLANMEAEPGSYDRPTNIGLFRRYINEYLKRNELIHNRNFTLLVRELDPTPTGLPIELYIFTKETNWSKYEDIQADIFDHLLSILPEFGLKTYQISTPVLDKNGGKGV